MKRVLLFLGIFIGLLTTQAQIVNVGTLKIEPGTSVYFGDHYTNSGTHTNDGDLHLKGNLTNNGTVTTTGAATGTTYFNSTDTSTQNVYTTDGTNLTAFYNLSINNTSTNGESLAVSDNVGADEGVNLVVNNNLHIENNQKLRLLGEAQLIQTHTGSTSNSGNGHLLKDQEGAQNATRYNYWSSPVQNNTGTVFNLSTVLKDGTTADLFSPAQVGFTASLDGNQNSPIELSTRWLWKYLNGSTDPWNDTGWLQLFDMGTTTPSADTDMLPGEGFCMKGTNPAAAYSDLQNYSFEGKPNDGNYTLTIGADKEYLVGNPYPSALDADQFITDNNGVINGTIYYWHHWSTSTHYYTQYGAGYATYNLLATSPATLHFHFTNSVAPVNTNPISPTQFIPVGQGFILRSTAPGSGGTINFNNGQRIFNPSSVQIKSVNKKGVATGIIRLGYEEGSSLRHRNIVLGFTDGIATDSFDYGYDAEMIDVGPNDMYFNIIGNDADNRPYVIQGVGSYDIDAEYPLTVKTATPGSHRIMIDDLENFDEALYILDEKGNTHDLRVRDYVFVSQSDETQRHLSLVFKPQSTIDIQENLNSFVHVYYTNSEIVIQNEKGISLTGLEVYNTLGNLVLQIDDSNRLVDEEVRIPFNHFAQTAYILKLHAEIGNGNYKFINY